MFAVIRKLVIPALLLAVFAGSGPSVSYLDDYIDLLFDGDRSSFESSDHYEYTADDSEYAVDAVIYTEGVIRDLKVLKLELIGSGDEGDAVFAYEELYSPGTVTRLCPLVLRFSIPGLFPQYGISYIDIDGDISYYALSMSGMDGSLLLSEISVMP